MTRWFIGAALVACSFVSGSPVMANDDALARWGRNARDSWRAIPEDKRAHIEVESEIGGMFSVFVFSVKTDPELRDGKRAILAMVPCAAAGIGKEALDETLHYTHNYKLGADPADLGADAVGCAAGLAVGWAVGRAFRAIVSDPVARRISATPSPGGVAVSVSW